MSAGGNDKAYTQFKASRSCGRYCKQARCQIHVRSLSFGSCRPGIGGESGGYIQGHVDRHTDFNALCVSSCLGTKLQIDF